MFGLLEELWVIISMDNPTTYYKLLQVSKIFKLDTDMMKAKFIRKTERGDIDYYRLPNGWLHSCNDQPAIMQTNGTQCWYINGDLHRDNDQPAIIYANGDRHWRIDGKLHRDNDKPAEIWANGTQRWLINNELHRDNDQPAEIWAGGECCWYTNGVIYRDDFRDEINKLNI